jgi:hypothetical protein
MKRNSTKLLKRKQSGIEKFMVVYPHMPRTAATEASPCSSAGSLERRSRFSRMLVNFTLKKGEIQAYLIVFLIKEQNDI